MTHDEIETIKNALQYVYDNQLRHISENKKILGAELSMKIMAEANRFFDIQSVFDGERDV